MQQRNELVKRPPAGYSQGAAEQQQGRKERRDLLPASCAMSCSKWMVAASPRYGTDTTPWYPSCVEASVVERRTTSHLTVVVLFLVDFRGFPQLDIVGGPIATGCNIRMNGYMR